VKRATRALVIAIATAASVCSSACMRKKEAKVDHVFVGPTAVCVELQGGEVRCAGTGGGLGLNGAGFRTVASLRRAAKVWLGDEDGCAELKIDGTLEAEVRCFGPHFASIDAPKVVYKQVLDDAFRSSPPNDSHVNARAGTSCEVAKKVARCHGPLEGLTIDDVSTIAFSGDRACGLRANGDVACIRAGAKVQDPLLTVSATDVALSTRGLCVLHKTGEVSCEDNGKLALLSGVYSVKQLAAAGGTTCFLKDEGVTFCWGDNANGELGLPGRRDVPTALFFRASETQ
jgi:hypothetical protein